MFEIDFHNTLYQRYGYTWLKIIIIVCCINSFLLFIFKSTKFQLFAMLFPFVNCGIIDIIFIVIVFFKLKEYGKDKSSEYIRKTHPNIWKRLHPLGKYSHNFFAYWSLIRGKFDDGSDEKLNEIKSSEKAKVHFILWVNLLTPFFWVVNLSIIHIFVKPRM